jgi:hypothetical protein
MRFPWLCVPIAAFALLVLGSCNHRWEPTGPGGDYVHIVIQNDSTASIWAPVSSAITPDDGANQILPGGRAEFVGAAPRGATSPLEA